MAIDYYGSVYQNTGENWIDTPLTLSTANPSFIFGHPDPNRQGVSFTGESLGMFSKAAAWKAYTNSVPRESVKFSSGRGGGGDLTLSDPVMAESVATGDIGASHKFKVQYPVNVNSSDLMKRESIKGAKVSHNIYPIPY